MLNDNIFLIIVITSVLTFLIRYLPITLLHGRELPLTLYKFLRNLPIALLAALITQSVFIKNGQLYSGWEDFYLIGFIASIILAIITRNMAIIVFGSLSIMALIALLPG